MTALLWLCAVRSWLRRAWAWVQGHWLWLVLTAAGVAAGVGIVRSRRTAKLDSKTQLELARSKATVEVFKEQRDAILAKDAALAVRDEKLASEAALLEAAIEAHKRRVVELVHGPEAWREMDDAEIDRRFRQAGL